MEISASLPVHHQRTSSLVKRLEDNQLTKEADKSKKLERENYFCLPTSYPGFYQVVVHRNNLLHWISADKEG